MIEDREIARRYIFVLFREVFIFLMLTIILLLFVSFVKMDMIFWEWEDDTRGRLVAFNIATYFSTIFIRGAFGVL